jgi:hypothetical protein
MLSAKEQINDFLRSCAGKGCDVGCCGIDAYYAKEGVADAMLECIENHSVLSELKTFVQNIARDNTKENARALQILSDIWFLAQYLGDTRGVKIDHVMDWADREIQMREKLMAKLRHNGK